MIINSVPFTLKTEPVWMINYMTTLLPILSVKVFQRNRTSRLYRYIGIEREIYFKEMILSYWKGLANLKSIDKQSRNSGAGSEAALLRKNLFFFREISVLLLRPFNHLDEAHQHHQEQPPLL